MSTACSFIRRASSWFRASSWDRCIIGTLATGAVVRKFDAGPLHTYEAGQAVHFGGVRTMGFNRDAKLLACGGLHKATNPLGAVHEPLVMRLRLGFRLGAFVRR